MCDFGTQKAESFSYNYIRQTGELSIDTFRKVIDSVGKHRPSIWFMAIEPLLYPHILDAIAYSAEKGFKFQITTNGLLLPKMAKGLVDSGIHRINLSIDGPNAAIHDKIRGREGIFEAAWEGIHKVVELRKRSKQYVQLNVSCCINPDNIGHLEELVKKAIELDLDAISFLHYQYVSKEAAEKQKAVTSKYTVSPVATFDFDPTKIDVAALDAEIKKIKEKYKGYRINFAPDVHGKDLEIFYYKPTEFLRGYKVCYYPWRYLHILPNADVIAAYRCFSGKLGNLEEKTLDEIWNDRPFREFRRDLKKYGGVLPACARCSLIFCSYYL